MTALTDTQRSVVLEAAERVPDRWRERFIHAVTDRLLGLAPPTDEAVGEAIETVARRLNVNITLGGAG
ncbi:MAG: hypothetical protein U1E81_13705 [Xanthobacteraceae bacterium]